MTAEKLLAVSTTMDGKPVQVNTLSNELQVDYLISNHFQFFKSRANKLWRMQHLYHITNKDAQKVLFKLNRAQKDFADRYLLGDNPFHRLIILKSRQLGFTTLIALWFLDEIIWNPNTEALQIAHTQKDATEIFNRKANYAMKNMYGCVLDYLDISQKQAKKVQFSYPDGSTSSFTVSNSGRSGTNHFLHISELGKLAKAFPIRADEITTGTLPSVPASGTAIIESTAEGQSGLFYEMYSKAMDRRPSITAQLSAIEFYPVFYNWTWDDQEIDRQINITGIIPVSTMKPCEINWQEYQEEYSLTDKEISFYYAKYIAANEDIDKLHQEFPTTELEAFIGSGSNYFSLRKTSEFYNKCTDDYQTYDWLGSDFIEEQTLVNENFEGLIVYHKEQLGRNYVIGGDVAEGLQDGDYSIAVVLGMDKQIKALYRGHCEPDEFSKIVQWLGKRYNNALLAVEFNKDGNWVNTDLLNSHYPNLYIRTVVDDYTHEVTKSYGWLTAKKTRDFMLGEAKKHFNSADEINCRPLLQEIMTFIRDKRGKPAAASKKHDDIVIAWCIAVAVLQGKKETITEKPKVSVFDLIFSKV